MTKEVIKLVDDEGENQAVRMFLALYGVACCATTEKMRKHLKMAGFDGAWPEWANSHNGHLTKAGAQLWIRHLFNLEQPAQPQQEPVAWYKDEDGIRIYYESKVWDDATPLYTSPPQRTLVGLTVEEIEDCYGGEINDFARAIKAKLDEKNT